MMRREFTLVAAGRAYTDIVAEVNAQFLKKYNIPVDGQRECSIAELQLMQSALPAQKMFAGGASANTAAIISDLGGRAGYFGKVFRDAMGAFFLDDFIQHGVELCCHPYEEQIKLSGTCLVLVSDEHRSFAYNPGCSNLFSARDFNEFNFLNTDFYLVEAHLLTHAESKSAIENSLRLAENKTRIVINLHGILSWENDLAAAKIIAAYANIIVGNEMEQRAFNKETQLSSTQMVITTKGKNGAEVCLAGCVERAAAIVPKKLINTVGAGDGFIAGFLYGLSKQKSISESLNYAVKTAAAILGVMGGRLDLS